MNVLIVGADNIGSAIAYYLSNSRVDNLAIIDHDALAIQRYTQKYVLPGSTLTLFNLDIFAEDVLEEMLKIYDVIISTLPWDLHLILCTLIEDYSVSLFGIAKPDDNYYRYMDLSKKQINAQIIHGCGFEPGLTELFAQHLACHFTRLDDVFISCGNIPADPIPPLNYHLASNAKNLPFTQRGAYKIANGELQTVPRFSDIEELYIDQMGSLECWHDGLTPWLARFLQFKGTLNCSQKTIRWPGYATIVNFLNEAGFLSNEATAQQSPLALSTNLLLPKIQIRHDDIDMVILGIWAKGFVYDKVYQVNFQLIDYRDTESGLTALARATGFSCALIAEFIHAYNPLTPGISMISDFYSEELIYHLNHGLNETGMKIDINFNEET